MPQAFIQPFGLFGNTLRRVNAGFVARPPWFEAMKNHPPPRLQIMPNVDIPDGYPEDKLYAKLLRKRPWLKFDSWTFQKGERTIATRFAFDQYQLMKHEGLSEEEAFERCDKLYAKELTAMKSKLFVAREVMLDRRFTGDGVQSVLNAVARSRLKEHQENSRKVAELRDIRDRLRQRLAQRKNKQPLRKTEEEVHNYPFPGLEDYAKLQRAARDVPPEFRLFKRDMDLPPLRTLMSIVEGSVEVERGILPENKQAAEAWFEKMELERVAGRERFDPVK